MEEQKDALARLDAEIAGAFEARMRLLGAREISGAMTRTLFGTLEEIRRCQESLAAASTRLLEQNQVHALAALPHGVVVGCPGVPGAYTHMACEKFFPGGEFRFYTEFEEVAQAVSRGEVEFGVLPVENSSAGQVNQALELCARYRFYVCADTRVKVEHCLCIHPDTPPDRVGVVLSHPQALAQCAGYLRQGGYTTESYSNTSTAAKEVAARPTDRGCVCSLRSAQLYGLRVLAKDIQDHDENYTRFICISRHNVVLQGADTVSLMLSFANQAGALNQLLTRFAVCDLDLCRIQSMPIASRDFSVRFHLDFKGSIGDSRVVSLLSAMVEGLEQFVFLGNFLTIE